MKKEETRQKEETVFEGMTSVRVLIDNLQKQKEGNAPSDRKILTICFDETKIKANRREYDWLCHRGEEYGFSIVPTQKKKIDELTVGNSHGGVVAVCSTRNILPLTDADLIPNGFFVMLEGIEDPYNFGYALRSLYTAGCDAVVLSPRNWMGAAGVVCRSSAGASERLPLFLQPDNEQLLPMLHRAGYRLVCADLRDAVSLWDADLSLPLLLAVGGEKRGISRDLLRQADISVRIDYRRPFDGSLSAASAATLMGYEIFRQNRI